MPVVAVVIPTLGADIALRDCLQSLEKQTFQDFEVIVVDNSGAGAVRSMQITSPRLRIIENSDNVGFGAAINQGWRASACRYVATLNDDAVATPNWLRSVVGAAELDREIGLVAAQVRLSDDALDSAGIVLSRDGSSKQRGHGCPPCDYDRASDVLLPSGSAALYRREMLDDTGGFADEFFLYCEDTDLGLRARRRGWRCRYVPDAIVYHAYSRSAGRASELKALLVERNRLFLLVRNFPKRMLIAAPFMSLVRYVWHVFYLVQGKGKAADFAASGGNRASLPLLVLRAHWDAARRLKTLLAQRREIRSKAYLTDRQFEKLLDAHLIPLREVAAH